MKRLITTALLVGVLGTLGCGGTDSSVSGISYSDSILTGGGYTVRAQLGDLDGAAVSVKIAGWGKEVWSGTTTNGVFKIPDTVYIQDDATYIIEVSGGTDLDTNDDGFYGDSAQNRGTIYAIVTGKDIKDNNLVVSPLTTYAYETLYKYGYFNGRYTSYPDVEGIDNLKTAAYQRLKNTFGNIYIHGFTIYTWGMDDDIYNLMKDYIDDIRNGETDKLKIAKDMKEIKNNSNVSAYCVDFIPETGRFIPITDPNCNKKKLTDWDYYEGEVKVESSGSEINATGVTVSSATFQFPDGRKVDLFTERPGDIVGVEVAGKDIYALLIQPSGDGILYHFENTEGVIKEEDNISIPKAQKLFIVTNSKKTSTGVFVQTEDGVYRYDSELHELGSPKTIGLGVTVEIPGYYFIKLSNDYVYVASGITEDYDKYIYSEIKNSDGDGFVYVNGKQIIFNNCTSVESNSKKTFFGNYLFYQPGNDTSYDIGNVTMINLDYVL